MSSWKKMIIGITLIIVGLYFISVFFNEFIASVKGVIPAFIVLIGTLMVLVEIEEANLKRKR